MVDSLTTPGQKPASAADVNRAIGRSSLLLMAAHLATYGGRFFKAMIIANYFGTGVTIESYNAALNLPLVVSGVLWGALMTALVPMLVELRASRGEAEAARLWTRMGLWCIGVVSLLCVVMAVAATPLAARIIEPGKHDLALTAHLLRLLLGYLALYVVVQFVTLIFHSHRQFVFPMITALPNLVVNIIVILVWFRFLRIEVAPLVWGLYAGAAVQLVLMIVSGWRSGILRPHWGKAPALPRAVRNTGILLLAGLVSPATLVTVDLIMARTVPRGIAILSYAYPIFMVPVTVGIMNLGLVLLPYLSEQVVRRDFTALNHTITTTTRVLVFILAPMTVGLWCVSEDLVRVVLERGEFTRGDSALVASALRAYVWGLVFSGLTVPAMKIFNALQRVRAITLISALCFGIKILANDLLREPLGATGIALGTSIFYGVNFALLTWAVHRTVPVRLAPGAYPSIALMVVGAVAMGIAVEATRMALLAAGAAPVLLLACGVLVGVIAWLGWVWFFGMQEFRMIWSLLRRRAAPSAA